MEKGSATMAFSALGLVPLLVDDWFGGMSYTTQYTGDDDNYNAN